tara:strand:+ start:24470 stop:25801 length:1332 start_codon:yes stop_codon:yes gene_type:complete
MFGQITERFQSIFREIRGVGVITDENIDKATREVRRALLEADVNFIAAKSFVKKVQQEAKGLKVYKSVKPGDHFIKIVHEELVKYLGKDQNDLNLISNPSIVLLAGLQGAGKTTTAGKLANYLVKNGKSVCIIAADIYRPAAIDQLNIIAKSIGATVYSNSNYTPENICRYGLKKAVEKKYDVVIIDTAGRLHNDPEMMAEIDNINNICNPCEILYVADGMTGQDAVNSASEFNKTLNLTGVILTKMDGDTRGGAAISIMEVVKKPIKFIGVSEKMDGLKVFDPKRIADRILGFGDILSLVEKAKESIDEKSAYELQKRISKNNFTLDDFRMQLQQINKMGPLKQILSMMPGMNAKTIKSFNLNEKQLSWTEAIINSMTKIERNEPKIINGSRRARISNGSGRPLHEINQLLKQFAMIKKMMAKMKSNNRNNKFVTNMIQNFN